MAKSIKLILLILLLNAIQGYGQSPPARFLITINTNEKKTTENVGLKLHDVASTATTPPNISYQTPQLYLQNQTITPLAPTNNGGAVPASIYGQVSTIASGFGTITSVAIDATGNMYLTDYGSNQIKKVTPAGAVSILAGNAFGGSGSTDGQGTAAGFNLPDGIVIDAAGNLYATDMLNSALRKITPGGLVTTFAGGTSGANNGTGTSAQFNYPRGMCIDDAGNIYLADQANNQVRKITPAGVVTTYAGTGNAGFSNGTAASATFNTPTGVGLDASGNLFVADEANGAVRKITPAGIVSTYATGFNLPREVRCDFMGNCYVSEQSGYVVKKISPAGVVTILAGNGSPGSADGIGTAATLNQPIGLILDGKGNLLVADYFYLRKISVSGYTIDKALPPGLSFDRTTGIISGKPTALSASTNYTITAYNGSGSSTIVVNLAVLAVIPLKPSIITLPPQQPGFLDASQNYDPKGTSTNTETPITYTSSDPAVATVTADGLIHVVAPGQTIITANQKGNANYLDAQPAQQTLTVVEYLSVDLPIIAAKTVCDVNFSANGSAFEAKIPLVYTSSNPSVATVSSQGIIHIVGTGTTTITLAQNADPPLYVSATPQSQTLTVTLPVIPNISIAANYTSPCLGSPITFTATPGNTGSNPTYQWQVNGKTTGTNSTAFSSSNLANIDKVTCTCTNNTSACIAGYPVTSNTITVNLVTPSNPSVSITASVNYVYSDVPITFTASAKNTSGNINYQWQVNGVNAGTNNTVFTNSGFKNGDVVTCLIATDAQCSTPATSNPLTVNIVTKLDIPNTFTPNGDGINDTWNIIGIASYPNCLVSIYNRYGTLVFQSRGYPDAWRGTFNGASVPVSTYYYLIDLGFQNKIMSGQITIIR